MTKKGKGILITFGLLLVGGAIYLARKQSKKEERLTSTIKDLVEEIAHMQQDKE